MKKYQTIYASPVGNLLIQCADDAIEAVLFTTKAISLHNADEHPILQICVKQLTEYFNGTRTIFNIPLQQSGTPFQQKVWMHLCNIPFGKTISYKELSHQYGNPLAIRAIASANGKNNLPIIVPCHRVIGSNKTLTGYAGGLWRKRWLLEHEARWHSGVQQLF